VELGATLSVEVTVICHRLPADVAHVRATTARHFVAPSFFDKLLFALPASPTENQEPVHKGPQDSFRNVHQIPAEKCLRV
jgi:hypothetical protein